MDKMMMNQLDDMEMELDNMEMEMVAGGKVEFPKFLRFLKKDTPPKKPTVSPNRLIKLP